MKYIQQHPFITLVWGIVQSVCSDACWYGGLKGRYMKRGRLGAFIYPTYNVPFHQYPLAPQPVLYVNKALFLCVNYFLFMSQICQYVFMPIFFQQKIFTWIICIIDPRFGTRPARSATAASRPRSTATSSDSSSSSTSPTGRGLCRHWECGV
jgi:hypothetical protein